ncbi:MAG: zinc ribbon domain-containing protein, partial [Phycisphaerales bacterium]|nr:zinc ribbon domain-containing protein [Phycisphaerales bacterium]
MGRDGVCGECGAENLPVAHFCCQCGAPLDSAPRSVGRARHPAPSAVPEGYHACDRAADLYYRIGSAWGGRRLLGTENLGISIFNAGYALEQLEVRVIGVNAVGRTVFDFPQKLASAPKGAE